MKKKILLVDDSPTVRLAYRRVLERRGFEVLCEENPVLVPSRVLREKPSMVLLDVQMPLLSGDVVARITKAHGAKAHGGTQIILFSTLPEEQLEELVRDSNADGYIQKPDSPDAAVGEIEELLRA